MLRVRGRGDRRVNHGMDQVARLRRLKAAECRGRRLDGHDAQRCVVACSCCKAASGAVWLRTAGLGAHALGRVSGAIVQWSLRSVRVVTARDRARPPCLAPCRMGEIECVGELVAALSCVRATVATFLTASHSSRLDQSSLWWHHLPNSRALDQSPFGPPHSWLSGLPG